MVRIRAGLNDVIEHSAAHLTIFRGEIARQYADFLKRVDAGLHLRLGGRHLPVACVLSFDAIRRGIARSAVTFTVVFGTTYAPGSSAATAVGFRIPELPAAAPTDKIGRLSTA